MRFGEFCERIQATHQSKTNAPSLRHANWLQGHPKNFFESTTAPSLSSDIGYKPTPRSTTPIEGQHLLCPKAAGSSSRCHRPCSSQNEIVSRTLMRLLHPEECHQSTTSMCPLTTPDQAACVSLKPTFPIQLGPQVHPTQLSYSSGVPDSVWKQVGQVPKCEQSTCSGSSSLAVDQSSSATAPSCRSRRFVPSSQPARSEKSCLCRPPYSKKTGLAEPIATRPRSKKTASQYHRAERKFANPSFMNSPKPSEIPLPVGPNFWVKVAAI